MCVHLENIRSLVLILATFEDCHVYDGADIGDLVLRRRGWGLLEVTASPADSGQGSGWRRHAANQWDEHKQPQTHIQHGDATWNGTSKSMFKLIWFGFDSFSEETKGHLHCLNTIIGIPFDRGKVQ